VLTAVNGALHGLDLPPSVAIGGGLYLPHPVGTVITAESIGNDVEIQSGVTVGMRNTAEFPRIEDGAFLGTGCKVLGAVTIGRGARIGANAVVVHSVPQDKTAVGVPARVIGDDE
jgi:serine O-acetyltransferase